MLALLRARATPPDPLRCTPPAADADNPSRPSRQYAQPASRLYLKCKGRDYFLATAPAHRRQTSWDGETQKWHVRWPARSLKTLAASVGPFHIRRQLEKHHAQPFTKHRRGFQKVPGFLLNFMQTLEVSDALGGLQGKAKVGWDLSKPILEHASL